MKKEEIVFKEEFEKKLSELGIRDAYVNNFIKDELRFVDTVEELNELELFSCFGADPGQDSFICSGFSWENSLEGYDFWHKIDYSEIVDESLRSPIVGIYKYSCESIIERLKETLPGTLDLNSFEAGARAMYNELKSHEKNI